MLCWAVNMNGDDKVKKTVKIYIRLRLKFDCDVVGCDDRPMTEAGDVKVDREPSFTLADGREYPGTYIYTIRKDPIAEKAVTPLGYYSHNPYKGSTSPSTRAARCHYQPVILKPRGHHRHPFNSIRSKMLLEQSPMENS
jgi:hypothetical protein